jgi:hypothetical protein
MTNRDMVSARFETTGSPVTTYGEHRKYGTFGTYFVHGMSNSAPDGFRISLASGQTRRMPRLGNRAFLYQRNSENDFGIAMRYAHAE